MTGPESTHELIEEAKTLCQGMRLLERAQRATLGYLDDLIQSAYQKGSLDLAEATLKCQHMMQEDIELFDLILYQMESFIEGDIDEIELVEHLMPEFNDSGEEDLADRVDAAACLAMMRAGCRDSAAATKQRAEGLLHLGFAEGLAPAFEEQARKAIEYAREVIAFLAP